MSEVRSAALTLGGSLRWPGRSRSPSPSGGCAARGLKRSDTRRARERRARAACHANCRARPNPEHANPSKSPRRGSRAISGRSAPLAHPPVIEWRRRSLGTRRRVEPAGVQTAALECGGARRRWQSARGDRRSAPARRRTAHRRAGDCRAGDRRANRRSARCRGCAVRRGDARCACVRSRAACAWHRPRAANQPSVAARPADSAARRDLSTTSWLGGRPLLPAGHWRGRRSTAATGRFPGADRLRRPAARAVGGMGPARPAGSPSSAIGAYGICRVRGASARRRVRPFRRPSPSTTAECSLVRIPYGGLDAGRPRMPLADPRLSRMARRPCRNGPSRATADPRDYG
jgi:hypothetical protein